jgi:hypothetical protein
LIINTGGVRVLTQARKSSELTALFIYKYLVVLNHAGQGFHQGENWPQIKLIWNITLYEDKEEGRAFGSRCRDILPMTLADFTVFFLLYIKEIRPAFQIKHSLDAIFFGERSLKP